MIPSSIQAPWIARLRSAWHRKNDFSRSAWHRNLGPSRSAWHRQEHRRHRRPRGAWHLIRRALPATLLMMWASGSAGWAQTTVYDLADVQDGDQEVLRIYGAQGRGQFGVPLAGGHDVDGDGLGDVAVAYMTATYDGQFESGEVDLIFGNGLIDGSVDTAVDQPRVLRFVGSAEKEHLGSEVWMDDVTGDGLGDLLICRQDYTQGSHCGVGALTIVAGGAGLKTHAQSLSPVDLAAPAPAGITMTTLVGQVAGDRFCIWLRTGDVNGDGIQDLVVGADQDNLGTEENNGSVWVIQGGPHLATGSTVPLGPFGFDPHPLDGLAAKINPPSGTERFHMGGTCQLADLDGNGRAEVIFSAALNRAGATLKPVKSPCLPGITTQGVGGSPNGRLYVAWDDNFPASPSPWPDGYQFTITTSPGSRTVIEGESLNESFGEEMLGGLDYDDDGNPDLFVGDLIADGTPSQNRVRSGYGHLFWNAADLKGAEFDLDDAPKGVEISRIFGPIAGALGADTAAHGDFDGDGIADLAFANPHDGPQGRSNAGSVHLLLGRNAPWPAQIDLASPPLSGPRVVYIQGANGSVDADVGDTLGYSAAYGDVDGDGTTDLIVNEMVGNGLAPEAEDVGNLLVIRGRGLDPDHLFSDGFESGDTGRWQGP